MGNMWWIIGAGVFLLVVCLFALSLCQAASDADDQLDEMWRRRQAERDE